MKPPVISMCDKSGVMVKPWAEAGFKCFCVDTQHSIRRDRVDGNITYVWGDVRSWAPPERPGIFFAFTPCTDLAVSGARDFKKKSWPLLRDGMDLFHAAYMAARWGGFPYMLENSVGRISGIFGEAEHIFDPCDYGDPYTKSTCLWTGGGFVMPSKNHADLLFDSGASTRVVEPGEGSRMHKIGPSAERSNIRSQTPRGFAQAVFEANHRLIQL